MAKGKRKVLTDKERAERKQAKVDNFIRLAQKRMTAAIAKIGYVGNCFSAAYTWTPQQSATMIKSLNDAVANVEARASKLDQKTDTFSF